MCVSEGRFKNGHRKEQQPYAKQIISLLSQGYNETVLAWVPRHRGITRNESADSAAKSGAQYFPYSNIPIPPPDFRTSVKSLIQNKWSLIWHHTSTTNKL